MEKKIIIEGMSCEHCAKRVMKALKEIPGITDVAVDLDGKFADVKGEKEMNDEILKNAIHDAGYEVVAIH